MEHNRQRVPIAWKSPFLRSLTLHILLLAFLLINLSFQSSLPGQQQPQQTAQEHMVNAVTVNEQAVQEELQNIKNEQNAKAQVERAEQQKLKSLQAAAIKAKEAREEEVRRLKSLIVAREKAEKEHLAEQKASAEHLAKLKTEQEQAQKELKKLAQQRQVEQEKAQLANKAAEQQKAAQQKATQEKATQEKAANDAKRAEQQQQQMMDGHFLSLLNKHQALILQAIGRHWLIPDGVDKKASCQILVRVSPDGGVVDVQLLKSSGNELLDRSAIAAVFKASPLPIPTEADMYEKFRELSLTVRPEGLLT